MSIIEQAALILHAKRCSCVIVQNGNVRLCNEHGIKDLYQILKEEPEVLLGATVADKVIGKGAAALMILGGVKEVYADVISRPALKLFLTVSVHTKYGECVPNIINRTGTGICPVETLCADCESALDCMPMIEKFVTKSKK